MPIERLAWIGVAVASIVLVLLELLLAPALSRCCFPSTEYAFFTDPLVKANLNPGTAAGAGYPPAWSSTGTYRHTCAGAAGSPWRRRAP